MSALTRSRLLALYGAAILLCGCGGPNSAVTTRDEVLVLPLLSRSPSTAPAGKRATTLSRGELRLDTVWIENRFLRVQVIPSLGGQVYRAVYKPTGDDLFYCDQIAQKHFPFLQSGVRASFPKAEHGMFFFGQPTGRRIVNQPDGSITLAMWMEFSRQHAGASTPLLLSQHVTLRPDEAMFHVTYRVTNPTPYRVGRQCWNDTFFPRTHTQDGVVMGLGAAPRPTTTEWIYPASYASFHSGAQFRRYRSPENPLAATTQPYNSVFAWDMPYGFAGLWYPHVKVNRLRIWDPATAPGAKQFYYGDCAPREPDWQVYLYNLVELWGGTDCVFEGVENWLEPLEAWQFTHTFALIRDIGKVDYADQHVTLHVELGGPSPRLEVVALRPVTALTARMNGLALGTAECRPDKTAVFAVPTAVREATIELVADGRTVLSQKFPLPMPDNTARHDPIRRSLDGRNPTSLEMLGNAAHPKFHYLKALSGYPPGSVGRGRVLYRDGQLDAAVECLKQAVAADADEGEAWHLLGMTLLEQGQLPEAEKALDRATRAVRAYSAAHHFLAIASLSRGDRASAIERLRCLDAQRGPWESRLLLAALLCSDPAFANEGVAQAQSMAKEDPADPRLAWVLLSGARQLVDQGRLAAATRMLDDLLREPGAGRRLDEFKATTEGRYVRPQAAKQ